MPTHAQRLIFAVRTRNFNRLRELIRLHGDVSARSKAGRTALHAAAEDGNIEMALFLIEAGCDVNARIHTGETPLHLAAARGGWCDLGDPDPDRRSFSSRQRHKTFNPEVANMLARIIKEKNPRIPSDLGGNDTIPEENREDVFSAALECFSDLTELHREFVSRGVDVDRLDPDFSEFLRGYPRYLGLVELLLEKGAELDILDNSGQTPLRGAVELGTQAMVELLLQRGANPNPPPAPGKPPESLIDRALEWSKVGVADVLLRAGAYFDPDASWQLHTAAANGRTRVVQWLLDNGADLNRRNDRGDTPLLACRGHDESVACLLARKADVHARNHHGDGLLHAAAAWSKWLEMVLDLDLPIDEQNADGETPLHLAARSGDPVAIQTLLRAGASINVQDHAGNTPLHLIFSSDEFRPDLEFPLFHALVSAGADRQIQNRDGKTAFDLAVQWQYPEEYLGLLKPGPPGARHAESFIWLGAGNYPDLLPKAMVSFELDGRTWPSCEHYFYAQKTADPALREKIWQAGSVDDAKCRFREAKTEVSPTWSQQCDAVMRSALLAKIKQHKRLYETLAATGNAVLISDSNCDMYWLERPDVEFNTIGKMLMSIRAELNPDAQNL